MKNFLVKNKLQTRNYIIKNSKKFTNIKLLIGFFPVFLGIYNKLYYKYYQHVFFTCLKTNLPGIYLQPKEISCQIFDQILVPQLQVPFKNVYNFNVFQSALFKNIKKNFLNDINNKNNYCYNYSTQQLNFYNNFILMNININLYKKQKKLYIGKIKSNLNLPIYNLVNNKNFQRNFSWKINFPTDFRSFGENFLQQSPNIDFNIDFFKSNTIKNETIIGDNWRCISAKKCTNYIYIIKNIYKKTFLNIQPNKINSLFLLSKNYSLNEISLNLCKKLNNNQFTTYYLNKNFIKYKNFQRSFYKKRKINFLTDFSVKKRSSAEQNFVQSFAELRFFIGWGKQIYFFPKQSLNKNFLTLDELPIKLNNSLNNINIILGDKTDKFWLTHTNFRSLNNFPICLKNNLNLNYFKIGQNFSRIKYQNNTLLCKHKKFYNKISVLQGVQNLQSNQNSIDLFFKQNVNNKLQPHDQQISDFSTNFQHNFSWKINFPTDVQSSNFGCAKQEQRGRKTLFFAYSAANFIKFNQFKNVFLQNLIKIYSLKTNLTFTPYSKLLQSYKIKILKNQTILHQYNTINMNQFNNEYNLQKSFELLKLLELHIHINKNTNTSSHVMSGYFSPNIKNKYNIFKLNVINNFLLHIKTSKDYLQSIDYTNFQLNLKKFLDLKNKKNLKQNFFYFLSAKFYKTLSLATPNKNNEAEKLCKKTESWFCKKTCFAEQSFLLTPLQNFSTTSFFQNKINNFNFNFISQPADYIEKKKKTTKKQQHYIGLAIIQNINSNELEMENSLKIKDLMHQFLGSDNPLTDHQENFFGKNISYFNSENYKTSIFLKNLNFKIKDKLLKNKQKNRFFYYNQKNQKIQNKNIKKIKFPLLKKKNSKLTFKTLLKKKMKINQKKNSNITQVPIYKTIHIPNQIFSKKNSNYVLYLNQVDYTNISNKLNILKKNVMQTFPINKLSELVFLNSQTHFVETKFDKSVFFNCFIPNQKNSDKVKGFQLSNQIVPFILQPINQLNCNKFFNLNLKNKNFNASFYKTRKINEVYLPTDFPNLTENLSINYVYSPYSQKLIKENVPTKFLFGKMYQKNYSVYQNKFNYKLSQSFTFEDKFIYTKETKLFHLDLQPISKNSWFFITQFTVGFLLIKIVQTISKKYQQELKYAISNLLENENKDANNDGIISDPNNNKQNFKIIKNIVKNFDDIAGIDNILPELAEITLFLRNSNQLLKNQNPINQKILLTGPPGTGKTFLVQAIAGEAQVPILIESGSSLAQSQTSENSSEKLKNLFDQAEKIAPCIVFIDEIDTFCQARNAMMKNPILNNDVLHPTYATNQHLNKNKKISNLINITKKSKIGYKPINYEQKNIATDIQNYLSKNEFFSKEISNKNKLKNIHSNLLLQFLVELDSISNKKIIVFGATNREQILDLALTRPGRFNKIIKLKLPNKQKRIEIIKLYTKKLGFFFDQQNKNYCSKNEHEKSYKNKIQNKCLTRNFKKIKNFKTTFYFSWDYLAQLTLGLSASDLASAINQSSIKAIQTETIHTLKTIEYGIESICGYTTQKNKLKSFTKINRQKIVDWKISGFYTNFHGGFYKKRKINLKKKKKKQSFKKIYFSTNFENKTIITKNINQLAYYQAGKTIVHTLLKKHPSIISIRLWPELKNFKYYLMINSFQKEFSQLFNKIELESRIIGFYAGKAGEFLNVKQIKQVNSNEILKKKYYSKLNFAKNLQNTFSTKHNQNPVLKQAWVKNITQLKNFQQSFYKKRKINFSTDFFYVYQSNFGIQDNNFANFLAFLMVNKWYLYCKKISIQNNFDKVLKKNYNEKQILSKYKNNFLKQTCNQIENIVNIKKLIIKKNNQNYYIRSNIQKKIMQKLDTHKMYTGFACLEKNDWYKIYGRHYQENENTKDITPDMYWTNHIYLKNLKFPYLKYRYQNFIKTKLDIKPILLKPHKFLLKSSVKQISQKNCRFFVKFPFFNVKYTKLINLLKKNENKLAQIPSFSNIRLIKILENSLTSKNLYASFYQCSLNYYTEDLNFKSKIVYEFFEKNNNINNIIGRTFYTKNNLTFFYTKKNFKFILLQNKLSNTFLNKLKNYNKNYEFFNKILKNCNHKNLLLLHTIIDWNHILHINHDYIYTSLILICFNKSISILNHNRELLDLFVSFLLQNEIIREFQIKEILKISPVK